MSAEDKLAILEGVAAYSHTLDGGDDVGWIELFTEDAVWEAWPKDAEEPSIRYVGHDGLRDFAKWMRERAVPESQARHNQVNTIFEELTADTARIRSNALITMQLPEKEPRVALTGVYADTWKKVDGRWLIAHRALYIDR